MMLMMMMGVESISKLALFELKNTDFVFLFGYIALQDDGADDDADRDADDGDDAEVSGIYFKIGSLQMERHSS